MRSQIWLSLMRKVTFSDTFATTTTKMGLDDWLYSDATVVEISSILHSSAKQIGLKQISEKHNSMLTFHIRYYRYKLCSFN